MALAFLVALFAVALVPVAALSEDFSDATWKTNPVSKVIHLLQDMADQLDKEQEEDEKTFDLMACWCETNDKIKTKAIADAQSHLTDLGAAIEELTAKSSQLTTDIATLEDEIAADSAALKDATAIRKSDNEKFVQDETESKRIVKGLTGAVEALAEQHESPRAEEAPEAFLQAHVASRTMRGRASQPVAASSYDSQSGAIFGVLGNMKDEFSENLAKSQEAEAVTAKDFSEMSVAKKEELIASKKQLKEKKVELADAKEDLANSKNDETDTSAQLELDVAFLADLKTRCAAMDKEWEDRQAMRKDESTAVTEAIAILSDDEAKDLAHKTVGSFVQVAAASRRSTKWARRSLARAQAAEALRQTTLSGYAAMLQEKTGDEGVFAQLQETIRDLIKNRKNATLVEQEQKDYCTDKLDENDKLMTKEHATKEDVEGKIDDLHTTLKGIDDQLEANKAAEKTAQIELLQAGTNRKKENLAFQMVRVDQRATQEILQKALAKLQAFYSKKGASLAQMQKANAADAAMRINQAPPAGFKPYKKAGGNGGVVGFLENIIAESAQIEKEGIAAEQEAQAAYDEFATGTSASLKALATAITDAGELKAKADGELVIAKEQLATALKNLFDLTEINKDLHSECDFVLNGFTERQEKRLQEIEALQQADKLLDGAQES